MSTFSQVSPDVIRKRQTNNSTSKNAYPFSKTKRFPQPNPQCKIAFYSYDSQISKRKASIGYGKKPDWTQIMEFSPVATKYEQKSLFETGKQKGKSFGLSRDRSPDQSYLIPQLHKVPGPGQYENQVKTKMTVSYTMREKTKDFIEEKMTHKKDPGPGTYQEVNLEPKQGRFAVSKFADSKFAKINSKPPRFAQTKQSPGPFSYHEGDSMSSRGKYVLSQRAGRGTRPFDKQRRKTFTDTFKDGKSKHPGVGYYDLPSDFGVYGQFQDPKMKATIG